MYHRPCTIAHVRRGLGHAVVEPDEGSLGVDRAGCTGESGREEREQHRHLLGEIRTLVCRPSSSCLLQAERVEKDGKHTIIKRTVVTPSVDIAWGPRTHLSLPGGERPRGGLSISSQSVQSRYLPEHGVRPAAACLVHPFGVAAAVAALQQRVGFVTHVGGEHLGWPNAGTLRSQRVGRRRASSLGLHCAALRGAPHAARAHRLSSGAHKAIGVRAPSRRRGMLSPLSGAWRPRGGLGGQPCAWAASHAP